MRRIVIGACLVFLVSGAAWATEDKAAAQKCTARLIQAEAHFYRKIKAKALSEAKAEEITELLDDADRFCTEGKYSKARTTLGKVRKMASKASEEIPDKAGE